MTIPGTPYLIRAAATRANQPSFAPGLTPPAARRLPRAVTQLFATTGPDGTYQVRVPPGQATLRVSARPDGGPSGGPVIRPKPALGAGGPPPRD